MKTDREKELDDLFKQGLENPAWNANFRENDWDAMEDILNKHKKRAGIIYWLPILSSAAALLLIVLGLFLFKNPKQNNTLVKNNITKHVTGNKIQTLEKNGDTGLQQTVQNQSTPNTVSNGAINSTANKPATVNHSTVNHSTVNYTISNGGKKHINNWLVSSGSSNKIDRSNDGAEDQNTARNNEILAVNMPSLSIAKSNALTAATLPGANVLPEQNKQVVASAAKHNKINIKQTTFNRPRFAITVLASPDINGVNSFQNSRVGTNAGLMFSVGLTKKFTISTGALYSKKPYMTDFDNYHSNYKFKTDPESVSADCRVLDIPINIDYQVYHKSLNTFSVGSGLSSYIMLRENYHYSYEYPNTVGPTDFNIVNRNQHFLGVLNLDATYQRKLNSKISLGVEPYLKIPLTNIGASQVKLQSTGVAVGLTWNINSSSKP